MKKQMKKQNQKGITLIALIITIIVMLILVGVTINVALNGGLFSKAEEAGSKTKIAQIQEALTLKKAEVLAETDGKAPADYGITINNLNLPTELRREYENKLVISKDAKLYYDASVVTNIEEQNLFKSMGIQEYAENNIPEIYKIGYEATVEGVTLTQYLLENQILIQILSSDENQIAAVKNVTLDENKIVYNGNEMGEFSQDHLTCTIQGIELARNENKIYEYNPNVFDETYHIYLNALYVREDSDYMIYTFTEGLDKNTGENPSDNYILFADMKSKGVTVSEDGEQITYNGNTYTRLK